MKLSNMSKRRYRTCVALGLSLSVALAISACGSDSSSSNGSSSSSGDTGASATLDELYEGTYMEPNGPVIAEPAAGKSIWVIPAGLNAEVMVDVVDGVEEAAAKVGWDVTVFDGKFSPTTQLTGVQQAVAAGADGIITYTVDCPSIKNGLDQAKEAGVPTINIAGSECDSPAFAYTLAYPGFDDYQAYLEAYGAAQADFVIQKTGGMAKVIISTQTDNGAVVGQAKGIKEALEKCSDCEVLGDIEFVGADFGPTLQSKVSQELLKHPEADAFIAPYDAILVAGGAQALRASGRLGQMLVVGGECSKDALDMIRDDSGMDACLGYDATMEGFGAINYLVNIFDGKKPSSVHNGIGWQAVDAEHNLPEDGEAFTAPVDFVSVYNQLWGLN